MSMIVSPRRSWSAWAYGVLAPFPFAFFVAALATDLIYVGRPDYLWVTFSVWLVTFGMIAGALAAIAGLAAFATQRWLRQDRAAWILAGGLVVSLLIGLANAFIHSRDGYKAVMPLGLALSVLSVAVMLAAMLAAHLVADRQSDLETAP